MREDVAAKYQEMQSQEREVIYSQPPESVGDVPQGEALPDDDAYDLARTPESDLATDQADDTDFELSTSLAPSGDASKRPKSDSNAGDENGESHSVATGGDVLLQVALDEQKEEEARRKHRRKRPGATRGGFLVYCPNGHRVEVQERHRGMTGRCPRCQIPFFVPAEQWSEKSADDESTEATAAAEGATEAVDPEAAGTWKRWLNDVHVHAVDPTKLKLKVGSLESEFTTADFGFSADEGLLIAILARKGGMFGSVDAKKLEATREETRTWLREGNPIADLPAAEHHVCEVESLHKTVTVVQPAPYAHESMFAGVDVFGTGRIAVSLPKFGEGAEIRLASFHLTQFRRLSEILKELWDFDEFGADAGVPLTDETVERECHYTEQKLRSLEDLPFYEADPEIELTAVGYRCQECGLVISEDGRKKEKIGGKSPKGLAKAKCPKCQKKFGTTALYARTEDAASEEPAMGA